MVEEPFEHEIKEIQEQLKQAIFDGNAKACGPLGRELRRYWAIALVRGYRTGFHTVNEAMLSVAAMAHTYADHDNPKDPLTIWYRVWEFLGETGNMIQQMNTNWAAEDRLAKIKQQRFKYADQTLLYLHKKGLVTFATLKAHMGAVIKNGQNQATGPEEERVSASLNNHLRRLIGYGLVDRAGWGLYSLTYLGEHAAKLLEKKVSSKPKSGLQGESRDADEVIAA